MKNKLTVILLLSLAALMIFTPMISASAQATTPTAPAFDFTVIWSMLQAFLQLGGVAGLFALIINVAKYLGWVKDGNSGKVLVMMNFVGLVIVVVLHYMYPTITLAYLDSQAVSLTAVISFFFMAWSGQTVHNIMASLNVPVLGSSYSNGSVPPAPTSKHPGGQGLVEYALILVLVAVVAIVALMILGPAVANIFSSGLSSV